MSRTRWQAAVLLTTVLLTTLVGVRPAQASCVACAMVSAFIGPNDAVQTVDSGGRVTDTRLGARAATSPSIAALPTGAARIAFQANTGILWIVPSDGVGVSTGLGMRAGTSPAIAASIDLGFEVAFVANTGQLWRLRADGTGENTGIQVAPGTSPSIAAMQYGFVIAYQAPNGNLHVLTSSGDENLGLGMALLTSPSIAATPGGWEIAFQANDGYLWRRDSIGTGGSTGLRMSPGTSPSVAVVNNQYVVAGHGADHFLYMYANGRVRSGFLGMRPGTNPAVSALGDNTYQVAFVANTGQLWTVNSTGGAGSTGQRPPGGTSPAVVRAAPNGPAQLVTVPNLYGKTFQDATDTRRGAGLSLGQVTLVPDCDRAGSVIAQSPAAGQVVLPGTLMNIIIASC